MYVREFMSPEPWTIKPDRSLVDAKEAMLIHRVRRLPVTEKGTLVGIITKEDILAASPSVVDFMNAEEIKANMEQTTVQSIMAEDPYTVDANDPVEKAARIMKEKKIGGLPVLDDGKLVGMITETDIFRLFVQMLGIEESTERHTLEETELDAILGKAHGMLSEGDRELVSLCIFQRPGGGQRTILRTKKKAAPKG